MSFFFRRLAPPRLVNIYHRSLAAAAMYRYGLPSRRLVVIGVTGTDGKTTTATMIADLLKAAGYRVGLSSSVYNQIADRRWVNESHLTMPGPFSLQRMLRQMVDAGCQYAVLEVSSEGLAQSRHRGIDFDVAVLTNLSPEHIQAHGSFTKYRRAKELLFGQIIKGGDKVGPDGRPVKKVIVVNADDPSAGEFLKYWAEEYYAVSLQPHRSTLDWPKNTNPWFGQDARQQDGHNFFSVDGHEFELPLPGEYNVMNALEALAVTHSLGVDWSMLRSGLRQLEPIPGRWQEVPTKRSWRVVVDYALTPRALKLFYQALQQTGVKRIIAVFGAAGGGRDSWKRPELGKIAGQYAAQIILTTDDPYDENPERIAGQIMAGVPADKRGEVEVVIDRRLAIRRAMELAQPGDVIAVTGMGAETSMMIKGESVPWNDVAVAQELLSTLSI